MQLNAFLISNSNELNAIQKIAKNNANVKLYKGKVKRKNNLKKKKKKNVLNEIILCKKAFVICDKN